MSVCQCFSVNARFLTFFRQNRGDVRSMGILKASNGMEFV